MTKKTIRDEVLGEFVWDKKYLFWKATIPMVDGTAVEIRLIGPRTRYDENGRMIISDARSGLPAEEVLLQKARQLVPWLCTQNEAIRGYAADQLLDLHNEIFGEKSNITRAVFIERLKLFMAAIDHDHDCCTINYHDGLGVWAHNISVTALPDKSFFRADTVPRLFRPERKIQIEPFPPLVLLNRSWEGKTIFKSWRGFSTRLGAYGSKSSRKTSDGTVRISVAAPGDGKDIPSKHPAEAFRYLIDHEIAIRDAVLKAITSSCQKQELDGLPSVGSGTDLKKLIGLSNVHINSYQKKGRAYVGFEFGCDWDEEHNLGVMTHGMNVVEVGYADTSFLEWIAERDGGALV